MTVLSSFNPAAGWIPIDGLFVRLPHSALLHGELVLTFEGAAIIAAHEARARHGRCPSYPNDVRRYPLGFILPQFTHAQAFAVAYFKSFTVYHALPYHDLRRLGILQDAHPACECALHVAAAIPPLPTV